MVERLTIDKIINTTSMCELAHNQFFVKDHLAFYRDFDREIDCRDLVREIAVKQGIWKRMEEYGLDADNELVDDDIFEDTMLDALMYGTDKPIGVLAMYYSAMWGMAEIREVLKEYEDTNLTPDQFKELDKLYLEKCEEINQLKENQTPKKPISKTYSYAGEVPYTKYMCPTGCCKIAIHRERDNYCPKCGQVIDWSVEG